MTKYQQYFRQMIVENPELFSEFGRIHDAYKKDSSLQGKYNEVGAKVSEVIRDWEKRLCLYSEKGTNAKYSANLAEKFWQEVRNKYSHIDLVGCE